MVVVLLSVDASTMTSHSVRARDPASVANVIQLDLTPSACTSTPRVRCTLSHITEGMLHRLLQLSITPQ